MEQSAVPEESANNEEQGNDHQRLAAPEDIFKAKSRLGR